MTWTARVTAACSLALVVTSSALAQVAAVTTARHDLRLAFTVPGRVQSVTVKPGDRVEKGQPLIVLDDRAGEAQIAIYQDRADSTLSVDARQAALEQAQLEERGMLDAYREDAAGKLELDRKKLEVKIAQLELQKAKDERVQARRQLDAAKVAHESYTLDAPIAGVIEEVVVNVGETVEPLKPVLRLVVTNPLWIDAYAPLEQTLPLAVGGPAWGINTTDVPAAHNAGKKAIFEGKIVHIAQVADARSGTRLVRVEVSNTSSVPAGGHVTVYFSRQAAEEAAGVNAVQEQLGSRQ